jgi:methyl-accepting chemotaxis protein
MSISPSNTDKRNGFLAAFGIFGLSSLTYPFILSYSRLHSPSEIASIYLSPASLIVMGLLLVFNFLFILRNYRVIGSYLHEPRSERMDTAQKTLIEFPRKIIAMSLVFTIASVQIILFFHTGAPSHRMEHLFLSFSNAVFFGIPLYIIFYQRIEKWGSAIPYTTKYTALQLSGRITIVVMFSILAVCAFLIITMRETVRLAASTEVLTLSLTIRSVPIVTLGFLVGVVNITMIMQGVAYRIQDSNYFAFQLGEGNLSGASFTVVPRDEFGSLANGLNLVRDKIQALILSTKTRVQDAITAKNQLLSAAAVTDEAVAAISTDVLEVNSKVEKLDGRTDEVLASMEAVNQNIDALNGQITTQASRVEESTAAVTEMIASLNSISSITARKLETTGHLIAASGDGKQRLDETIVTIKQMNENIERIIGMVSTIQGIAAQTNLLAMNAAIEAAHAGDYGRGFAVVADEIRKLAETSAVNSKKINGDIKNIIDLIRNATSAGDATSKAFEDMNKEIVSVVASFTEIGESVSELKVGGEQILQSVSTLRDISSNVSGSSAKMAEETGSVEKAMEGVKELFTETREVTAHMTEKIRTVADRSEDMGNKSRDIDAVTVKISESLAAFKTE